MVKDISVRKKFIIQGFWKYFIIMLLPVLVLEPVIIICDYHEIEGNIEFRNKRLLYQVESKLENMQQDVSSIAYHFSKSIQTNYAAKAILTKDIMSTDLLENMEGIQQYLQNMQNTDPSIFSIYVYFENDYGRFFDSRTRIQQLNNFYDKDWLGKYMNMKEISCYQARQIQEYDFADPVPVISIYHKLFPATTSQEESDGVIVVNYKQDAFRNYISNLALYNNQTIAVVNFDNEILVQNTDINLENVVDPASCLIEKTYFSYLEYTDKQGITYISLIPYTDLYEQLYFLALVSGVSLLLVLVLSIVLAWKSASREVHRLNNVISLINHEIQPSDVMGFVKNEGKNLYDYILYNVLQMFIEQDYMKMQYSQKKYKMEMLNLQALQQQINPHFMNNTLNSIYWEAIRIGGKKNTCSNMVDKLSVIMNYAMGMPSQEVTLREEIEYIKLYISIQEDRFKEKIDMRWDIEDGTQDICVIRMLLQPLIENAITHGIREKKFAGAIKCRVRQGDDCLVFWIIDTGQGVEKNKEEEIRTRLMDTEIETDHIGLFNTNLRLILKYGQQACLHFRSKYKSGTIIHFKIPII